MDLSARVERPFLEGSTDAICVTQLRRSFQGILTILMTGVIGAISWVYFLWTRIADYGTAMLLVYQLADVSATFPLGGSFVARLDMNEIIDPGVE